jgi:hypothetical protein
LDRVSAAERHVLASFDAGLVRAVLQAGRKAVYICSQMPALEALSPQEIRSLHALSARYELLSEGIAERARAIGVPLWVWTVDATEEIERAVAQGAVGICSNEVAKARHVLDRLAS